MKIVCYGAIADIPRASWETIAPPDFPFAAYDFLAALESTDCLGERTGWRPFYLAVWEGDRLRGAMPTFVKTNSYGEYIFDFAWAEAYKRLGLCYYPKLVAAIPFTPATGPKLLIDPALDRTVRAVVEGLLIESALGLSQEQGLSSVHALFITESEKDAFLKREFFVRHSYQFHWRNEGFASFADFLRKFRSKRRNEILRERRQVEHSGVRVRLLTGTSLAEEHADIMYRFYLDTVLKRGGFAYLTKDFFARIFETMADQIVFAAAENSDGKIVAGALNYFGSSTLFGRNWGCIEEYKSLHFELCYYQGIEFAIERNLALFEAGAQGEHKFHRGFLPALTLSAHRLLDSGLNDQVKDFVEAEKFRINSLFREYCEHTPFSRS